MNHNSREALRRVNAEPRRNRPRDARTGSFIPAGSNGKLRGVSARVRKYIRAMNENPDVLEQALVGALLASLKDSADWEREAIQDIRARRRAVAAADDPTGAERIKVQHEVLPIIAEIRKSRKLAQDLLARAAEIKARLRGSNGRGYLEDRYGDKPSEDQPEGDIPPDAEEADVLPTENDAPAEPPDPDLPRAEELEDTSAE